MPLCDAAWVSGHNEKQQQQQQQNRGICYL